MAVWNRKPDPIEKDGLSRKVLKKKNDRGIAANNPVFSHPCLGIGSIFGSCADSGVWTIDVKQLP
jgi:hypothetical protein